MPRTAAPVQQPASLDVSILIPTFRREQTVGDAVRSMLAPSSLTVEVLVADDSADGSARSVVTAIDDARVRYAHRTEPTGGVPARVRNELVGEARGRYFYFLDDDDTASIKTLAAIVARMDETGVGTGIGAVRPHGPDASEVVVWEQAHYEAGRRILSRIGSRHELAARLMFKPPPICCSACVIRREAFVAVGGFDTDLPLYEDIELYLQAIRRFGFVFIDRDLLFRRTGEPSLIQNERDSQRTLESYRMIYQRYRQANGWMEWGLMRAWAALLR